MLDEAAIQAGAAVAPPRRLARLASLRPAQPRRARMTRGPAGSSRLAPLAFALPALVFSAIMVLAPLVYTIWISLHHWFVGSRLPQQFTGFHNYVAMVHDPLFWSSVEITFEISAGALVVEVIVGVYLALLLDRRSRIIRWLRTLVLVPSVIPSVAAGMMWLVLFDPSFGFINYVFHAVGLPKLLWLDSAHTVIPSLIIVDVWQWTPFVALIVLGGLQALPREPLEAAAIDGAGSFATFRYVVLPGITPVIWVAVLLRAMDVLRIFDTIYVMTQGGPANASTSLNIYSYQQGFQYLQMGYASALMITLLVMVVLISVILSMFRRRSTRWL
jgi:multiple sugar transport system permease protein